jgi:hypothetical protein
MIFGATTHVPRKRHSCPVTVGGACASGPRSASPVTARRARVYGSPAFSSPRRREPALRLAAHLPTHALDEAAAMASREEVVAAGDTPQDDPAPRLAATFAELVEACDAMQWKQPTRIQAETIPHALQGNARRPAVGCRPRVLNLGLGWICAGRDLIALAQTGSGKTAAFALPILQALLDKRDTQQTFFACVLSPTRSVSMCLLRLYSLRLVFPPRGGCAALFSPH